MNYNDYVLDYVFVGMIMLILSLAFAIIALIAKSRIVHLLNFMVSSIFSAIAIIVTLVAVGRINGIGFNDIIVSSVIISLTCVIVVWFFIDY